MGISCRMMLDALNDKIKESHISHNEFCDYTRITYMPQITFKKNIIYILPENTFVDMPVFEGCCTIISTKRPPKEYFVNECSILVCNGPCEEILDNIIELQQYVNSFETHLNEGLLNGKDISFFTEYFTYEMNVSLLVFDAILRVISINRNETSPADSLFVYLEENLHFPSDVIMEMTNTHELPALAQKREPSHNISSITGECSWFLNLFDDDNMLGSLIVLYDSDIRFQNGIPDFIRLFEKYVLYIFVQKLNANASSSKHIFSELLSGNSTNTKLLVQNLGNIGWAESDYYCVLYITAYNVGNSSTPDAYWIEMLSVTILDGYFLQYDDNIVGIVKVVNNSTETVERLITPFLRDANLFAGISPISNTFSNIRSLYKYSKMAVHLGIKIDNTQRLYRYKHYAFDHLVYDILNTEDSALHYHQLTIALDAYDKANSTLLLSTLRSYLEHGCSVNETAQCLGIHRNTILHRITKIQQLFPFNLKDYSEQIQILITCRLMELDKIF